MIKQCIPNMILFLLFVIPSPFLLAQNVGIGLSNPHQSAKLDIQDPNKGLLIPRVALLDVTDGITPVSTPATGLLIFNTNLSVTGGSGQGFYYWNGTTWVALQGSTVDAWALTGNSGTVSTVNFIGTTDAVDWPIRTNNVERMRVMATGNVGISTATPNTNTILHVNNNNAVLFDGGSLGSGGTLNLGASVRLLWYPKKAAFMAGEVTGTQWDDNNIGNYSALFGYNNVTRGAYNLLSGENNSVTASGTHNIIGGINNAASGDYNLIGGQSNVVSPNAAGDVSNNIINGLSNEYGTYGIINGFSNESTRSSATINGNSNLSTAESSTIFGGNNNVSGNYSTAIGTNNSVSGTYGLAIGGNLTTGNQITGNHTLVFGDNNNASTGGSFNALFGQNHSVTGTASHNGLFGQNHSVSGAWAFASGFFNTISGTFASAIGVQHNLSGVASFTVGQQNNITGNYSAAIGVSNDVSGTNSQAIGYDHSVSGNHSISLLGFSGANTSTSGQECLTVGKFINNNTGSTYLFGSGADNLNLLQVSNPYTFAVGFRHTDPTLHIHCPTSGTFGLVGIARQALTNRLEVNGNASKSVAGSWFANSDGRLKKDRKDLNGETILNKIKQLQGVTYLWDDQQTSFAGHRPTSIQYGFIAQEFQEIFPDFVSTDNEGFLQMAYGTLDPLFVEAIKEQQNQIEELKEQVRLLKELVNKNN